MKFNATYFRFRKSAPLLILGLLLCFGLTGQVQAQKNGSKYDLNDPRNPDCPCHKYQKIADEEYARQLKHEKSTGRENENLTASGGGGGDNLKKKKKHGSSKVHQHVFDKKIFTHNRKRPHKHRGLKRFNKNISSCFHW